MGYINNRIWCTWGDWGGLFSWLFGVAQILNVIYCQMFIVLIPSYGFSLEGILKSVFFLFIALSALATDLKCALIDPGSIKDPIKINGNLDLYKKEGISVCQKCMTRKPLRAHHCSKCHTCIIKMDHHCPWVNNCVGIFNQKYFVQFIIYVFIGESYACISGLLQIFNFYKFLKRNNFLMTMRWAFKIPYYSFQFHGIRYSRQFLYYYLIEYPYTKYVVLLTECLLSLLFAIFVVMMFFDQLRNMKYDMTLIEQKKADNQFGQSKSLYECFTLTFGEPPCWRWLFPIEGKNTHIYYHELCNQFPRPIPITENTLLLNEEIDDLQDDKSQIDKKSLQKSGDIDLNIDSIQIQWCNCKTEKIE